jgi:hypothetical protein
MKLALLLCSLTLGGLMNAAGILAPHKLKDICRDPEPNTCDIYTQCLEARLHCGPAGYPIAYGLKYCNKSNSVRNQLSAGGKEWITSTMLCLQRDLVKYADGSQKTTCGALKDYAFSTHPSCYIDGGVCLLPPGDWEVIVKTVGFVNLFNSSDALVAALKTVRGCVNFYEWLIEQGILKVINGLVGFAEDFWETLFIPFYIFIFFLSLFIFISLFWHST